MELDDVLNDSKTPEAPPPELPPAAEAEPPKPDLGARQAFKEKERAAQEEGRARTADGKFAPKTEEAKAEDPKVEEPKEVVKPAQQELTEKERAFLARANDETRKRQELEKRLAALEAKQPPAEPAKTFYEDPDGALAQTKAEIAQHSQHMQAEFVKQRLTVAEMAARGRHADFDEIVPVFAEILQATPGLYANWLQSPDPAEFAYQTAKNMQQVRAAGSMGDIRAQIEKEARIKIEAEFKAREDAQKKLRDALPDSLSNTRGAAAPRVAWGGPTPLENVLNGK